ncbi:MAG: DUF2461 domain-containing protein [Actinomycetota bacterium]
MAFTGFGDATFRFMRDLGRHNDKAWFQAHRAAYEDALLEPSMAFIEAIGPLLAEVSPGVRAEPKIGGSMMRINRDIRFSKDKRPYKDHLDMVFKVGAAKTSPGYWFRLTPTSLVLGAGMHMLDKPELDRYRAAVDADTSGAELAKMVTKLERAGYDLGGEHYKRVPTGFAADHPREALLRHAGIYMGTEMEVPAAAKTSRFPAFCASRYKKMAPLIDWLTQNVA